MSRTLLDIAAKVALTVCLTSACTACATKAPPEPVVRTVEVKVPVPVACVPASLGAPPAYVDTDAALKSAAGPEDRFQLLAAGRIQRNQRLAQVEPVIKGCRQ
jgi:hypothetical protein